MSKKLKKILNKKFLFFAFFILFVLLSLVHLNGALDNKDKENPESIPEGYKLVWSDEFNNSKLDKWEIATTDKYYWLDCDTNDNAYTDNDNLVLRINSGPCSSSKIGDNYNAGLIITNTSWKYGYFEVRSKFAPGKGISSSFWLLGKDWTWPPEIDIYESGEYNETPDTIYMSYHWQKGKKIIDQQKSYTGPDYSRDYHIFAVEWTPKYIRYIVDGIERNRIIGSSSVPIVSMPMQAILSINAGWEDLPHTLPQYYYIDYIRVYQK